MTDRTVKVTLVAQAAGYIASMQQAGAATSKMADAASKKLQAQQQVFAATGKAATAFGLVTAAAVASAVAAFAQWDAKMAQVQSLSKDSVSQMAQMRDATMQYATQFGISASQAADAEIELVKGGASAAQIMGGALTGALTLASAGQMDVADATSIAVSAMTEFGLKGSDVGHVADLLAAGADKALGSVSDLGEGLKYVGPVAASMGVSIESTVGTLAELAQNGILADQAGTSLRGMLEALTSPSSQASKVMKQYGIDVFDTSGKFVGFDGVAQQLQQHLGSLTQSTRDYALGQIFGNQQITAATVLMEGGASSVDKWTKSVDDNGFAAEQASGKLNSLNGDLTKLKASFENDLIQTGEASNGVLRDMTQNVTKLLVSYGNLPQPAKDAALGFGGLTAAGALSTGMLLTLIPKIGETSKALEAMGLTSSASAVSGMGKLAASAAPVAGVLAAATAAGLALKNWLDSTGPSATQLGNAVAKASDGMGGFSEQIKKMNSLGALQSSIGSTTISVKNMQDTLSDAAYKSKGLWQDLTGGTTADYDTLTSGIQQYGASLANLASTDFPAAAASFKQFSDQYKLSNAQQWQAINQSPEWLAALKKQADALGITASQANLTSLANKSLSSSAKTASDSSLAAASSVADMQASVSSSLSDMASDGTSTADAIDAVSKAVKGMGATAVDATEAQVDFHQSIQDASDAVSKNGRTLDLNTDAGRANQKALDALASSVTSLAGAQVSAGDSQDVVTKTMQTGRDAFVKAAEAAGETADAANNLADQYGLVPSQVDTQFAANGLSDALATALNLQAALAALTSTPYNVQVTESGVMNSGGGKQLVPDAPGMGLPYPTAPGHATGGPLTGPGTGTSDSMLIRASTGEYITPADAAAKPANRRALDFMRAGGTIPGFATGGSVSASSQAAQQQAQDRLQFQLDYQYGQGNARTDFSSLLSQLVSMSQASDEFSGSTRSGFQSSAVALAKQMQTLQTENTAAAKAITAANTALAKQTSEADKARTAYDNAVDKLKDAKSALSDLQEQAKDLKTSVEGEFTGFTTLQTLVDNFNEASLDKQQSKLDEATSTEQKYADAVDAATSAVSDAQSAFDSLKSSVVDALEGDSSLSNVAQQLVQQTQSDVQNALGDALSSAVSGAFGADKMGAPAAQWKTQGSLTYQVPGQVTASSIQSYFQQSSTQAKQFAQAIAKLQGKGLSATVLQQLTAMGPQAGLQAATALLSAPASTIASINSGQASIASSAASLGTSSSSTGSGAVTAAGLVSSYQSDASAAKSFGSKLQKLADKGLNQDLLTQLASMGPDAGMATADALLSASSKQLAQINQAKASITSTALSTGGAIADDVDGQQLKVAQNQLDKATSLDDKAAAQVTLLQQLVDATNAGDNNGISVGSDGKLHSSQVASYFSSGKSSATAFATKIKKLSSLGLNADLLQQVTAMGPGPGDQVADALIAGGKSAVSSVNSSYSGIKGAGASAGAAISADVYGKQLKAAQDTVTLARAAATDRKAALQKQDKQVTYAKNAVADAWTQQNNITYKIGGEGDKIAHVVGKGLKVPGYATGGTVVGPGTGTSDTAGLFRLSNGEEVLPASAGAALRAGYYVSKGPAAWQSGASHPVVSQPQQIVVQMPQQMTLVDQNGSILAHAKVQAQQLVQQSNRQLSVLVEVQ